jgi:hypothetical protein
MRRWAWWGLGPLDFCGGRANTAIVHTTIMAPPHDGQRSRRRPPARRRGSHSDPPRCLKRLPTSLEASGRPYRRVEKRAARREPGTEATFRGRALCRGLPRRSRLRVDARGWALRFVGVA